MNVQEKILSSRSHEPSLLYMKGDKPPSLHCVVSRTTVCRYLNACGRARFCCYRCAGADPGNRDWHKVYSDWRTIPQLYIKGECRLVPTLFAKCIEASVNCKKLLQVALL